MPPVESHYAILTAMLAPAFFLTATASLLISANNRRRSGLILRASQMLYIGLSCFVGTSLSVAFDAFLQYRMGVLPTTFAVLGVLALFASSLMLSRESTIAVRILNEEMDRAHLQTLARMRR